MRGTIWLGLTLSLAACRQTVVLDESMFDGGGGGGGNGGTDSGFDSGPPPCTGLPTPIVPESPKMMVVLDRSDGMTVRFADSSTPLAVARDALDQYATRYQDVVWFGYSDFPGSMNCSPQTSCCAGTIVAPNPKLQQFSGALHDCDRNSSCAIPTGMQRPIYTALNNISAGIFSQSELIDRYILLITNGRPDCGLGPGAGSCGDNGQAQNLIGTLSGKYVTTLVVAPGQIDSETFQCLRDLVTAGGDTQPSYFHPSLDAADLNAQIGDLIRMAARGACTLDLEGYRVTDPQSSTLVWKGTQIVPRNDSNGWDVTGMGYTITLRGQSCDHLIDDGPASFQLFLTCGSHH
jgi:hypothetical protein